MHLEALEIYRVIGNRKGEADSLNGLGNACTDSGSEEAEERHRQALDIRREIEDFQGVAASLHNLGNVADNRGQSDEAMRLWENPWR